MNDNGEALKTWGRPPEAFDGQPRNTRTVLNLSPGEARKFHLVLDNASNPQRVLRLLDIRDAARELLALAEAKEVNMRDRKFAIDRMRALLDSQETAP